MASVTVYDPTSSAYVFPTSITTTTGVVAVPNSSSASGTSAATSTAASASPFSSRAGTYFQTVIISLVALALLTVLSALFIYYRRRRLAARYGHPLPRGGLDPSDWALHERLFPGAAAASAAAAAARRREKEERDYGLVPVIWEVDVDVKAEHLGEGGDAEGEKAGGKRGDDENEDEDEGMLDVSLDDVEGQLDGGDSRSALETGVVALPHLRPLALGILTTAPPPIGKPTSSSSRPNTSARNQSSRNRTYAYPGADEQYVSSRRRSGNRTSSMVDPNHKEMDRDVYPPGPLGLDEVDVWTTTAPGSVSFLIAMPQPPSYEAKRLAREDRRRNVVDHGGDFEEDEDDFQLPEVAIGCMALDLGRTTRETRKPSPLPSVAASPRPWVNDDKGKPQPTGAEQEDTDWEAMGFRPDEVVAQRESRTTLDLEKEAARAGREAERPDRQVTALNKEELVKLRVQLGLSAEATGAA